MNKTTPTATPLLARMDKCCCNWQTTAASARGGVAWGDHAHLSEQTSGTCPAGSTPSCEDSYSLRLGKKIRL